MAWAEYIATAQKGVDRIDRVAETIGNAFRRIKVASERQVRDGLRGWLDAAPKNPRIKSNAFLTISPTADYQDAYAIIDAGFLPIRAIHEDTNIRTADPDRVTNIHEAKVIMDAESDALIASLGIGTEAFTDKFDALEDDWEWNIVGITLLSRGIKEVVTRSVSSSLPVATMSQEITNWHINDNQFDLSTTSHPRAIVRNNISRAVEYERGEDFDNTKWTILGTSEPSSRVKSFLLWGLFTTHELNRRFKQISKDKMSPSDWRGLGFGYRSNEFYIPVPEEDEEEAEEWSKAKRKEIQE